jgi:hypothetical protein
VHHQLNGPRRARQDIEHTEKWCLAACLSAFSKSISYLI